MNILRVGCCDNHTVPPVECPECVLKTECPPRVQVCTGTTHCLPPYAKYKVFLHCCHPPKPGKVSTFIWLVLL